MPRRPGTPPYHRWFWLDLRKVKAITVHHTAAPLTLSPRYLVQEMVTHQDPRRAQYPEVPYHLYICQVGWRFVCCQLLDLEAVSWHADGRPRTYTLPNGSTVGYANKESLALALAGNWTNESPPREMLEVAMQAKRWMEAQVGHPLEVWAHREVEGARTACPGDTFQAWLPRLMEA